MGHVWFLRGNVEQTCPPPSGSQPADADPQTNSLRQGPVPPGPRVASRFRVLVPQPPGGSGPEVTRGAEEAGTARVVGLRGPQGPAQDPGLPPLGAVGALHGSREPGVLGRHLGGRFAGDSTAARVRGHWILIAGVPWLHGSLFLPEVNEEQHLSVPSEEASEQEQQHPWDRNPGVRHHLRCHPPRPPKAAEGRERVQSPAGACCAATGWGPRTLAPSSSGVTGVASLQL